MTKKAYENLAALCALALTLDLIPVGAVIFGMFTDGKGFGWLGSPAAELGFFVVVGVGLFLLSRHFQREAQGMP